MKISSLILFTFILVFGGCKAIDELTHFELEYNYTFTLPSLGGINLDNLNIESNDLENNTESTFENYDTQKDLVESAYLKKFNVTIVDPIDENFTFVTKVEIFVEADELEEKLIAWKNNIPNDIGNYLELETTSSNLRKYLISDEIRVRLRTESSKPLTQDLRLDLRSTVKVDAKILGI